MENLQIDHENNRQIVAALIEPFMWHQHRSDNRPVYTHSCRLASPLKGSAKSRVTAWVHATLHGHQHSVRDCSARNPAPRTAPVAQPVSLLVGSALSTLKSINQRDADPITDLQTIGRRSWLPISWWWVRSNKRLWFGGQQFCPLTGRQGTLIVGLCGCAIHAGFNTVATCHRIML